MPKTIDVRIPAVIGSDGRWAAYGYPGAMNDPDWPMVEEVADNGGSAGYYKRVWITATLELPEPEEVAATSVEPDGG